MSQFRKAGFTPDMTFEFDPECDTLSTQQAECRERGVTLKLHDDDYSDMPAFKGFEKDGSPVAGWVGGWKFVSLHKIRPVERVPDDLSEVIAAMDVIRNSDDLRQVFDGVLENPDAGGVRCTLTVEHYKAICTVLKHICWE